MSGDLFDVLGRGVSERHRARIGEHGGRVRWQRQEGEQLKDTRVQEIADGERRRQDDHKHDNEFGEEDQRPRGRCTNYAARVTNEPCGAAGRPRTL